MDLSQVSPFLLSSFPLEERARIATRSFLARVEEISEALMEDCVICWDKICDSPQIKKIAKCKGCGTIYHGHCIDYHYEVSQSKNCPICRRTQSMKFLPG